MSTCNPFARAPNESGRLLILMHNNRVLSRVVIPETPPVPSPPLVGDEPAVPVAVSARLRLIIEGLNASVLDDSLLRSDELFSES